MYWLFLFCVFFANVLKMLLQINHHNQKLQVQVQSQAGRLRRLMKRSTSSKSKRIAALKVAARSVGWKVTPYDRRRKTVPGQRY